MDVLLWQQDLVGWLPRLAATNIKSVVLFSL
jgi:hypothetical protein